MSNKQKSIAWLVVVLFVALSVVSVIMAGRVDINYSITDYLDSDTDTKQALEIITEEFGMNSDIKVMVSDISMDDAKALSNELSGIDGVIAVTFGADSYKDNKALFTVMLDGDEYSATANRVADEIHAMLDHRYPDRVEYGGTVISNISLREIITGEMAYILVVSVALVIIILLICAKSWLEPFVLLLASGAAVVINAGTNIIYGEVSYITNSVAAILQLALSIDYSIALLHTYRRIKPGYNTGYDAMLATVKEVIRPVSASGLTTIAGLLALLFMSFGIGFDIGIVLMKGIVISFVTSVTLFPALILLTEGVMSKTAKKAVSFTGKGFVTFAAGYGKAVICIFLALLVLCGVLKGSAEYDFTVSLGEKNTIAETFGANSTVMLVYESGENDGEAEQQFINEISDLKREDGSPALTSYTAYSNTVGEVYDVEKSISKLGVDRTDAELLFAMYYLYGNPQAVKLSVAEFVNYTSTLLDEDEDVKSFASSLTAPVKGMAVAVNMHNFPIERQRSADSLAAYVRDTYGIDVDLTGLKSVYEDSRAETMSLAQTEKFFGTECEALNENMALYRAITTPYAYEEITAHIIEAASAMADISLTEDAIPVEYVSGVYIKYAAENCKQSFNGVLAKDLLQFIYDNMGDGSLLSLVLTDSHKEKLDGANALLERADTLFKSDNHSRMLMYLDLPAEGEDTDRFMEQAISASSRAFGKAYLAGIIPSTYDLQQTFDYDNRLISIVTIVSIFLIVMIIFRSMSLPVILVAVIQCAIWLMLSAMGIIDIGIFFMSYIMSSCILMGATIDYGILMSSSYITARRSADKKAALEKAMQAALPTVFTSGMTMSVAGFVIYFIASQNAISTTGLLIGIGTVAAAVFVTLVLPSLLYVFDKAVLKLTMGTKNKQLTGCR